MVTIDIKPVPDIPNLKIITVKGSIDAVTSKKVDEKVFSVIEQESNIIIDLSKVHYLSSIGMMFLINYLKFMTDKKRLLKFVKPPEHVHSSLETAGIANKLDMYNSIEAAIRSLR
jgi:anti-anti-sigma factor